MGSTSVLPIFFVFTKPKNPPRTLVLVQLLRIKEVIIGKAGYVNVPYLVIDLLPELIQIFLI